MKVLGIKLEITGELDDSCDLVLINHQSLLDIIVIEYLHPKHLAWVAKEELKNMFFFGNIIKLPKMISIDRENKTGIIHLLKESRDRLSNDRPIAMFPEGTRGHNNKMLKFKPGAKILANKLNLKVQPIVVFNTREILDSKNLKVQPGIVKVNFLPPVQADKKTNWYEETEEKMKKIFAEGIKNAN